MPRSVLITLYADYDTGEASITRESKAQVEELIRSHPLLAADILKDCVYDFTELYNRAVKGVNRDFDARRAAQHRGLAND